MNRRNLVYASLVLIIVLILIVVFTGKWKDITGYRPHFSIADTSRVNRVVIAGEDTVILSRKANGWVVDEKYSADPTAVDNLLFAFSHLTIKGMRNAAGVDQKEAVTIEIRSGRRTRQFRFFPLPGESLMMEPGGKTLYNMGISGSAGSGLNSIVNDNPGYWKDKVLVSLSPDEIKRVEVTPAEKWGRGFIIEQQGDSLVLLTPEGSVIPDSLTDQERMLMYTSYFGQIFYDSTYSGSDVRQILTGKPDYTVQITSMTGQQYTIEMYPMKGPDGKTDIFHALVRFNHQDRLLVVRYVVLDLLRQTLSHFTVK